MQGGEKLQKQNGPPGKPVFTHLSTPYSLYEVGFLPSFLSSWFLFC